MPICSSNSSAAAMSKRAHSSPQIVPSPIGGTSSRTPPASPRSLIASSIMPRSSPSTPNPIGSKRQPNALNSVPDTAGGPSLETDIPRRRTAAQHPLRHSRLLDSRASPRRRRTARRTPRKDLGSLWPPPDRRSPGTIPIPNSRSARPQTP